MEGCVRAMTGTDGQTKANITSMKKHEHTFVPSTVKEEIYYEGADESAFALVEYVCQDENGEPCPNGESENRLLRISKP